MNAQNLQLVQQSSVIDEIESLTEINKKDLGVHAPPVERFEEDVHEIHQQVPVNLHWNHITKRNLSNKSKRVPGP